MVPLLIAAAAAAGLFYLHERNKSGSTFVRTTTGIITKGKSGETWTSNILPNGSSPQTLVEIDYQSGTVPAAPHMVIQYTQMGSDTSTRKLSATNPQTSPGLVQAALADFGVSS